MKNELDQVIEHDSQCLPLLFGIKICWGCLATIDDAITLKMKMNKTKKVKSKKQQKSSMS